MKQERRQRLVLSIPPVSPIGESKAREPVPDVQGIVAMNSNQLFTDLELPTIHPDGLIYIPNFMPAAEQKELLAAIDKGEWSQELRRRVQHYGYRYDYKARQVDRSMRLGTLPDFVQNVLIQLQMHVAIRCDFDQLIVNEYLPGQGIAAHIDCEPCFDEQIAIISLGWAYEMEFQNVHSRSTSTLMLATGSLLVLSGPARYEWTHQIRPRFKDRGVSRQRRVSLTFRKVLLNNTSNLDNAKMCCS
ncbi:MAG: alpha-ketoglutarate-dependent dioxygenase AlkB [Gemmataceae bacterium]